MCKMMEDLRVESEKKGEDKLGKLMTTLLDAGEVAKASLAASNPVERENLYTQYGIV